MTQGQWIRRVVKPAVFLAALVPGALLASGIAFDRLGPNPIEEITHRTGSGTLILLLATLAVTPVRRVTGLQGLVALRRMLGLFAYTYAVLHFATYLVLDKFFLFEEILVDIGKRPYITVGFTSLMLLTPLAITSTKGWVKRLGGARWNRLHQLVYVAAAGGVLHYLWLVKADTRKPIIFGLVLVALLAFRLGRRHRRRRTAPPPPKRSMPEDAPVGAGAS